MISQTGLKRKDVLFDRYLTIKRRVKTGQVGHIDRLFAWLEKNANDPKCPSYQCTQIMDQIDLELKELSKPIDVQSTF